MSDMQGSGKAAPVAKQSSRPKHRRKSVGGPQPLVIPSSPNTDAAYKGPVETYRERDEHLWFLEGLYGKQEDEPRSKRGRVSE